MGWTDSTVDKGDELMAKLKDCVVSVTQEDIDTGNMGDCKTCPVARAIRRVIPAVWGVEVNEADVKFEGFGTIFLPAEAVDFIEDFDNGREVEPFKFTLRLSKLGEQN